MGIGVDPIGVRPGGDEASPPATPSPPGTYLPETEPVLLLDLHPYDPAMTSEVAVGCSRGLVWAKLDDDDRLWFPRVNDWPTWATKVPFAERQVGGGSIPSFGDVTLAIGDQGLDAWLEYTWDGRTFDLYSGPASLTAFADAPRRLSGVTEDLVWGADTATLLLRSPHQTLLDQPVQQHLYAGTGDREGEDGLTGQPKPLGYGFVQWAEPVLLDGANQVYQLHDGELSNLQVAVTDGGSSLTYDGAVADVYAWAPVAGRFVVERATGLIRLGAQPVYTLAARFLSETRSLSAIITDLVTRHGVLTAGQIEPTGLAALDAAFPENFPTDTLNTPQLFLRGEATIANVLDELLRGVGGFWTFNAAGQLVVGLLKLDTSLATLETEVTNVERIRTVPPVKKLVTQYARTWKVHAPTDLAAAASGNTVLTSEWRASTTEPAGIATKHALARTVTVDGPFTSASGGTATVQTNLGTLLGATRHRYQVTCTNRMLQCQPGQTWTLVYPRWGLASGKDVLVLGVTDDFNTGLTTLEVLG